jgi:hypothetical protein
MMKSIACYFIACLGLFIVGELSPFAIGDRFYRFDRMHVFLWSYYVFLFLSGVIVKVNRYGDWRKTLLVGASCGLVSGLIAQALAIATNSKLLNGAGIGDASELIVSLCIGSVVFLTPVWGALSAAIGKKLAEAAHKPVHNPGSVL